jgi:protein gp37
MSDTTKIQWADATFNPWIGCSKVSAGCKNCYAENTTRARVLRSQGHETWGPGAKRSRTSAALWKQPISWNKKSLVCSTCGSGFNPDWAAKEGGTHCDTTLHRMRVFPSLCDWLDDEVPIKWLADFLKLIHDTPHLDWLLLTKRPENFLRRLREAWHEMDGPAGWLLMWLDGIEAPHNVWLGVSVENQAMADKRIPELLKIPAKMHFLSVEPMLGAVDLHQWLDVDARTGAADDGPFETIDWAIFGGESGPNARPCNVDWIRDGAKQCKEAGVAAFIKQLGANPHGISFPDLPASNYKLTDKKGGDISEFPQDVQIREFPHEDSLAHPVRAH